MIYEYSGTGARHSAHGGENEDAVCSRQNERYAVISLADGVSACRKARAGAEIASEAMAGLLVGKGKYLFDFSRQQIAEIAISHILSKLRRQAEQDLSAEEEYSSTVAGALFDKQEQKLLYFNLGDGMILAQAGGHSRILSRPSDSSSGCCVTTTRNAGRMVDARVAAVERMDSVLLCSDGAWRHMFDQNRIKPEVSTLLTDHDWSGLETYLSGQKCLDDYSFAAMSFTI